MQADTASSRINKSVLRALSTHLAAALGLGFMAMSSVCAQQPPPPCHTNPHAAEDKERGIIAATFVTCLTRCRTCWRT